MLEDLGVRMPGLDAAGMNECCKRAVTRLHGRFGSLRDSHSRALSVGNFDLHPLFVRAAGCEKEEREAVSHCNTRVRHRSPNLDAIQRFRVSNYKRTSTYFFVSALTFYYTEKEGTRKVCSI